MVRHQIPRILARLPQQQIPRATAHPLRRRRDHDPSKLRRQPRRNSSPRVHRRVAVRSSSRRLPVHRRAVPGRAESGAKPRRRRIQLDSVTPSPRSNLTSYRNTERG